MLSVALFSVLATAQADSMVIPCRLPTISASQPSPGQTDVPLDAFVQMVVRDYCDKPLRIAVDVELRKGDEVVERITVTREVREEVSLIQFAPSAPYEPNTEYSMVVYLDQTVVIPFTTGDALVRDVVGTVTVEDVRGSWYRDDSGKKSVNFGLEVHAIEDPDHLGVLEMFDANDTLRVIDVVAVDETRPLQSMYGDMLLDDYNGVCVAVRQLDGLGRTVHTTDAICPEIVKVGCSSMGSIGMVSAFGWIPLLPLLRRRSD